MPELPEVETVVRSIEPLVGRRIVAAELRCPRVLGGADADEMAAQLAGRRITAIRRYGKFIVVSLSRGRPKEATEGSPLRIRSASVPDGYLLIHLGMTGRLLLGGAPGKHTHAILTLDRGALLYDDSRQFGRFQFSPEFPARIGKLGPEPLEVSFADFAAAMQGRKTRIKALLLNQNFLRGIGNIYADEALFRAAIHPMAFAARIRGDRARRLYNSIGEVLREAIAAGGSSISDYVDAEGRKGFFQFSHRVYQHTGQPCVNCGTVIRRTLVAQRSSHFCPSCQKR